MLKPACYLCKCNCMNCFYTEECGIWMDDPFMPIPTVNARLTLNVGLCKARHEMPVEDYIFSQEIINPTDTETIEGMAFHVIDALAENNDWIASDGNIAEGMHLNLYVTGLTVALIAVLNVCRQYDITVTLWHFDRTTGSYYPQEVK